MGPTNCQANLRPMYEARRKNPAQVWIQEKTKSKERKKIKIKKNKKIKKEKEKEAQDSIQRGCSVQGNKTQVKQFLHSQRGGL